MSTSCDAGAFSRRVGAFAALGPSLTVAQQAARARATGQPLRLIVPFTPGTGIDLIARTVGPKLGERLGRPVVVDNRAGASGNIGTEAVVRAAPNGSTLLVSVNTLVMNRSLYPKLPFDPVKDLVPVSLTSWGQLLLVANPSRAWRSAGELVRGRQGAAGTHQLRQPRRRHAAPPVDGAVQGHQRRVPHPHPLPRHGAGGHGPAGRPGRADVPADPRGAAARQGRQAGGAGHRQRQAPPAPAAGADAGRGARPATSTWPCGTASSRRPARRPNSWRASTAS